MTSTKFRSYIFDNLASVFCAIGILLCGLAYWQAPLFLNLLSMRWQQADLKLPDGAILLPYDNQNRCRLREINTATGRIRDNGLVDCLDASARNAEAWRPLTNQQKAAEIRKSFRGE